MDTHVMLALHPKPVKMSLTDLSRTIDAASACAQVCTACADACLAESMVVELRYCIRLNQDCADICTATARVLSRQTEPNLSLLRSQLQTCIWACKVCDEECVRHAGMHEHCRICSEACLACRRACEVLEQQLR